MHREILHVSVGYEVDHINRNRLDNRKSNLRICSHAENTRNASTRKDNLSGHKGVSSKTTGGWDVRVSKFYVGSFKNFEDAVDAYKNASVKIFGDFSEYKK